MKELDFYEEYIFYLDWRLSEGQITKGKYSLFKISKSEYDKFIKRLETDESFNNKFVKILQTELRNDKIDSLIQEEVSEESKKEDKSDDFFDEFEDDILVEKTDSKSDIKIDNIFDEFDL